MVNTSNLSISALAQLCGLATHTLRFYEEAGVLRPARRAPNGHRRYRDDDVQWVEFVLKLKATGMPLADIRTYAELRAQGAATLQDRLAMLERHQTRLAQKLNELASNAQVLETKMDVYRHQISTAHSTKPRKST